MSGTFSSINTAVSALRYQRVALDVAGNNLANAATEGYVRRSVIGASVEATRPALWSRYEGYGDGVAVSEVRRHVDPLLDVRLRREHGNLSYLQATRTVLQRVDDGIGEPGPNGVSAALLELGNAWEDLALDPGGDAARQQVIKSAETLAQALRSQVRNVSGEEADQRLRLVNVVREVNTAASGVADLNRQIVAAEVNGTDASTLRDQRDLLSLKLAELTGAVTTVRADGMFAVSVAGVSLVEGRSAATLEVTSGVLPDGTADGTPITLGIVDGGDATGLPASLSGEVGAITDLLTTTLPAYRQGLDTIARDFADLVNTRHAAGYDRAGTAGGAFFGYDPADAAATLTVVLTDPALVAASSVPGGAADGENAYALSDVDGFDRAYQRLVNGFGSDVAAVQRQSANQLALTSSIDAAWEQGAGVNLDEETVNLVTAQRAYEAAARLMTTVDEMLDTLINRTGLVGR